jgi:hypothetical protein
MTARTGLRRHILLAALDDAIDYRDGEVREDAALADEYRHELAQLRASGDEEIAALTGAARGGN